MINIINDCLICGEKLLRKKIHVSKNDSIFDFHCESDDCSFFIRKHKTDHYDVLNFYARANKTKDLYICFYKHNLSYKLFIYNDLTYTEFIADSLEEYFDFAKRYFKNINLL